MTTVVIRSPGRIGNSNRTLNKDQQSKAMCTDSTDMPSMKFELDFYMPRVMFGRALIVVTRHLNSPNKYNTYTAAYTRVPS